MGGPGTQALGRRGEQLAGDFLCARGHRILAQNWRTAHLEVDLITEDAAGVHFVEVKALMAPGEPAAKVGPQKQRRLTAAALRYLNTTYQGSATEVFFDVVSVLFDGGKASVEYFPQAWIPLYT